MLDDSYVNESKTELVDQHESTPDEVCSLYLKINCKSIEHTIERCQKPCKFLAQIPVPSIYCLHQQSHCILHGISIVMCNKSYLTAVFEMFERVEYKKISTCRFQHVSLHTLLIQIFRPSRISKEIAPESDFCLACTADDNIEHIAWEVFK